MFLFFVVQCIGLSELDYFLWATAFTAHLVVTMGVLLSAPHSPTKPLWLIVMKARCLILKPSTAPSLCITVKALCFVSPGVQNAWKALLEWPIVEGALMMLDLKKSDSLSSRSGFRVRVVLPNPCTLAGSEW